jgi:hypothetical protein
VKSRWINEMIFGVDGRENGSRFHSELSMAVWGAATAY